MVLDIKVLVERNIKKRKNKRKLPHPKKAKSRSPRREQRERRKTQILIVDSFAIILENEF